MAQEQPFFFRYKIHHIIFWLVYASFWVFIGQLSTPPEHRGFTTETVIINLVYLVTHVAASYINMYMLMPAFLYAKKYPQYFLLLLLDVLFFSAIVALGFYLVFANNPEALADIFKITSILPATLFSVASTVGLLTAIKLYRVRKETEKRNAELHKEKLEAELNYLKAQMNPHFLFNAINNVYFLIQKDKELAAEMLLKFSELLRYQLYDCNTEYIAIQTELSYLNNYIDLEKIRKGNNVTVRFVNELEYKHFSIAPMLLIPFVENAFKYVPVSPGTQNYIVIFAGGREQEFVFTVENSIGMPAMPANKSGGIGIENVKRRLELLYPERHALNIAKDAGIFKVSLKIKIA